MSEQNRRRLRFTIHGLMLIGICVGIVFVAYPPDDAVAQGEAELEARYVNVEAAQYRRELALTNHDLASMGCTQAQAEAILNALKDWYADNKQALGEARASVRSAQKQQREAMRRFHVGPRDEVLIASLPALENAVAQAEAQRKATVAGAVPTLGAHLNGSQSTLWAIARANADRSPWLRFAPNLTDAQVASVDRSLRRGSRRGVAASDVLNAHLSVSQLNELQSAKDRAAAHLPGVIEASTKVFPPPPDETEEPGV